MIRIRTVPDDSAPADRAAIEQVVAIIREQFPRITAEEIAKLPHQLRDPLRFGYRSQLVVVEDGRDRVKGFALLLSFTDIGFCHLELISAAPGGTGGGIGGLLYEHVRELAAQSGARGLFLECAPDEPELCRDPVVRTQNAARLRFYERYGARPIIGTLYEVHVVPEDDDSPFLVHDPLGADRPLYRADARRMVAAILERKYGHLCDEAEVRRIVRSFRDNPVRLRPPRYVRNPKAERIAAIPPGRPPLLLVVNTGHDIHHVKERGYVEAPVRISAILREISGLGFLENRPARRFTEKPIREVHDGDYVDYIRRACRSLPPGRSIYPAVFPLRNATRPPKDLPMRAGYYCMDTFTPLNANAYRAARGAVDCALTGAEELLGGRRLAYSLVRPPGHHAERGAFGGFCYFDSAAIAAHHLSRYGRVALLDIDFHHGNGHQDIFYRRSDVLTVSIHGHPRDAYPYFSGFAEERGEGEGAGFNINFPLPERITADRYHRVLATALRRILRFDPRYFILSLGVDTAKGDPTGTWGLGTADFRRIGAAVAGAALPTLVVQEGGYLTRTLGKNVRSFLVGLWEGAAGPGRKVRGEGALRAPGPGAGGR